MILSEELAQMRSNYAANPLSDLRLPRPDWMRSSDSLAQIFAEKQLLLQNGTVHFAHIVQANTILFSTFPQYDCPANIVYSTDFRIANDPSVLKVFAHRLFTYKNQPLAQVPPEWREVARVITDEHDRSAFRFTVPYQESNADIHFLPILVFRKLLPRRRLCGSLLPVLTSPDCKTVMILPKRYWTKAFTKAWCQGLL